jgi:hypothetical protein
LPIVRINLNRPDPSSSVSYPINQQSNPQARMLNDFQSRHTLPEHAEPPNSSLSRGHRPFECYWHLLGSR